MATEKRLVYAEEVEELIAGMDSLPWEEDVETLVNSLTTVDAVEVVHGQWIEHQNEKTGIWHYDCSICDDGYAMKEKDYRTPNYCHNCGAKMDGDGNG